MDSRPFFNQPTKNKQKVYENIVKMSKNNDYTKENLLDQLYQQKYYKFIGIDLSRQKNTTISQQINFIGGLEESIGVTTIFIAKKQGKTILRFYP